MSQKQPSPMPRSERPSPPPAPPKKTKGLHERLAEIYGEIVGTNFETICDTSMHLDAATRAKCRKAAQRVLDLCDEHERLDEPRHTEEKKS